MILMWVMCLSSSMASRPLTLPASNWFPAMMSHRYQVGQPVLYQGREEKIENRGVNINKLPVYQVNGTWVREDELMLPPPI